GCSQILPAGDAEMKSLRRSAFWLAPLLAAGAGLAEEPQLAVTHHQARANGQTLRYTARAGLIPLRNNEAGALRDNLFFAAYTLDRSAAQPPRPLTFLWNGGPGANSSLVHLSGFGPRRIKSADDPAVSPAPPAEMEDNDATWLEFTDLVFVDP